MALQHLRSNTASKRPTPASMADGQLAINTNATSAGLFFKDAAGALVKVGPVHVGTSAPNSSPAGSSGNAIGEQWLDTSGGGYVLKIWDGSAWRSEAGEFVDAAGDTMTGDLVMNNANIVFEGSTDDGFETTLTVTDPTADRTITLPNVTGTVVTTGDTGTVTSTMIADGTIVNADINASAAIAPSKIGSGALPSGVTVASANIVDGTIVNADVNASAAIAGTKIDPDFGSQTIETTGLFSAAGGSAAAPSITFTGDTNTGIYSPGTDQVAISTSGTGRLFVDANGNVGVGISPNAKLHLSGSDQILRLSNDAAYIAFRDSADSVLTGYFQMRASDTSRLWVSANQSLQIATNNTERLRITAGGLVGIGTSAPDVKTAIVGSALTKSWSADANDFFVVENNGTSTVDIRSGSTAGGNIIFSDGDARQRGRIEYSHTSDELRFGTAGTNSRLVINSSGSVGIGTTSPGNKLHVAVDNDGDFAIYGLSPSASGLAGLIPDGTNGNALRWGGVGTNAGVLRFMSGASIERARIDSSGRLLVGTSTNLRGSKLQVLSTGNDHQSLVGGNQIAQLELCRSSDSAGGAGVVASGNVLARIECLGNDGSAYRAAARIEAVVDGTPGANDMPGRLVFSTTADGASSPTERMRINNTGIIYGLVSTTNGNYFATTQAAGTSATVLRIAHSATQNSVDGTISFNVYSNGNVVNTNNSYGAISDIKLKENIVDAGSQWSDIKALQVRKYNFKEGQTHTQIGLVAQEVELVSPGLVSESPDRDEDGNDLGTVTKSVNYSVLYMKAVKALQEAMERIETLEAKVAALETP